MSESKRRDPVLILGVDTPEGEATATPLFAAVRITEALVARLRLLTGLCRSNQLDQVVTRDIDSPVYWDALPDGVSEVTTLWGATTNHHQAMLQVRMPYREISCVWVEWVAQTFVVAHTEFENWRASGSPVNIRCRECPQLIGNQSFSQLLYRRAKVQNSWPDWLDAGAICAYLEQ